MHHWKWRRIGRVKQLTMERTIWNSARVIYDSHWRYLFKFVQVQNSPKLSLKLVTSFTLDIIKSFVTKDGKDRVVVVCSVNLPLGPWGSVAPLWKRVIVPRPGRHTQHTKQSIHNTPSKAYTTTSTPNQIPCQAFFCSKSLKYVVFGHKIIT